MGSFSDGAISKQTRGCHKGTVPQGFATPQLLKSLPDKQRQYKVL